MRALLTRIKRLETKRAIERLPPVELQIGYLKRLPEEYAGERHVVTVGRDPDGNYRWEERPGLAPTNEEEGNAGTIIRINLVPSPHEEWPAPASSEAEQP
jgi:hypothetical protein